MDSARSTNVPGDRPSTPRRAVRCGRSAGRLRVAAIWLIGAVNWFGCAKSADQPVDVGQPPAGGLARLRTGEPAWFTDRDDPVSDGWDSEFFGQQASAQLKSIAKLLSHPTEIDAVQSAEIADGEFRCAPLRPAELDVVFEDESLIVSRGAERESSSSEDEGAADSSGPARLAAALRQLAEPFAGAETVRVKFKLFRVTPDDATITTQSYYEASGHAGTGTVQQTALWTCRWTAATQDHPPRLLSIDQENYEQVATHGPTPTMFADCTRAVLGGNVCFEEQLMLGQGHWIKRIQSTLGINEFGHKGLAIGDINGDGLEDIYVPQTGGLPNRLFRQNVNGTATDIAAEAGVDFLERTQAALLLDLDNDGDQDLVLGTSASILLLANDGGGRFAQAAVLPTSGALSVTATDFDLDGDLDLYACNYAESSVYEKNAGFGLAPIPYHDANNGAANVLYRNDGEWNFSDVTDAVGLDMNNSRWSFSASWEDYDNDGDPDLYVANDFGRNNLYRNDAAQPGASEGEEPAPRRFVDVAAEAGVEDIAAGMSVSWGDANRDGWMDLYVGNMFSAAGNRVTFQQRFQGEAADQTKAQFQRLARGNSLFLNAGDGTFRDVSRQAAVTMGRWAWGSLFVDINNDGWEDLVVANGYVTNEQTDDL